ncbi:2-succinylbenzoate--CoA ligase [Calidithermus terrae]|uniref:2-succinylbenzoate--CoA ligase n=1 Tax=Calidithermus terrae TaxID=1408545 RepID=A0A399EXV5_9DEIN|nr:AMP-binding protein [Calidithermus terrae]RIH88510.1 2-succinylbenzoate--CoA ligase [Calidithermus terrae]
MSLPQDLLTAYGALARTGLLGSSPAHALLQFLACYVRYGGSLYTLAAWNARRFPQRLALAEPGRTVTFGELTARADRLACGLQEAFPAARTCAILGRNRVALVEGLLACARLGLDTLLLPTSLTPDQWESLNAKSPLDVLICDGEFLPRLEPVLRRGSPEIVHTGAETGESPSLASLMGTTRHGRLRRMAGRLTLLTSGTTGPAKAVRRGPSLEEALGVLTGVLDRLWLRPGEPTLLTVPLLHGHGLATLLMTLATGSPLFLFPKATPEDYLRCLEEQHIATLVLVPTVLYRLLEAGGRPTPALRRILCGSAPLDPPLAVRCLERFGPVLYNLYGSSEAGLISLATPEDLRQAPSSVGRPLPGLKPRILDEHGRELPPGEPGEVRVVRGGRGIPMGDAGYLDAEGRLFLMGRADDMLICGGVKVYPQAVEQSVLGHLEYVQECAAVGIGDLEYGQAIHLFVVIKPGQPGMTPEAVARDLEGLFPRSTRPKRITFVEALPRNLAGKVRRRELEESGPGRPSA